jgi:hypothetical protein
MTSPDNGNTDRNADRREWAKLAAAEKAANLRMQKIILGSLAAFAVVFGLGVLFMFSDRNSTATNQSERPATTTGTATGSVR